NPVAGLGVAGPRGVGRLPADGPPRLERYLFRQHDEVVLFGRPRGTAGAAGVPDGEAAVAVAARGGVVGVHGRQLPLDGRKTGPRRPPGPSVYSPSAARGREGGLAPLRPFALAWRAPERSTGHYWRRPPSRACAAAYFSARRGSSRPGNSFACCGICGEQ